ncbi:DUF2147 domain-containing protein [Microvirga pudoricolor]|uniref:DUF2147 domain-containing protein n=1 Tax=Microvirga pudoricolor TaxID=2778729 RepID=UPI00194DD618|nr:DUF2147 domain-containing protein [Microvirga pudoricolor]MBM6596090.1 DUF2147 domain-containing protein [Microvirga pudoricolor]
MKVLSLAALALLALSGAAHAQSADPSGTYVSETGETRVRIARCGAAWCGTIVSVKGETKDANNPDPSLRNRSLVGVQMISNIQPTADGWNGSLYNYKDGKTYAGKMKIKGNALELSGCVLGGLICRAQTWAKAS